jgi:hypothetical protein
VYLIVTAVPQTHILRKPLSSRMDKEGEGGGGGGVNVHRSFELGLSLMGLVLQGAAIYGRVFSS